MLCLSSFNPTVIKQLTEHSGILLNGMSALSCFEC